MRPKHRLVSIEDVDSFASFLVNDQAAALTGQPINGSAQS
jgi:hypothetical protein